MINAFRIGKQSLFLKMTTSITEFKAKCLELIRNLELTGEPITIMRHKTPVAVIYPANAVVPIVPPWHRLRGTVTWHGSATESVWDELPEDSTTNGAT